MKIFTSLFKFVYEISKPQLNESLSSFGHFRNFRKKKKGGEGHTLYGVSIINRPSLETQGMVPCWKKVTYIKEVSFKVRTKKKWFYQISKNEKYWRDLTWSDSRPKYLWLSKYLRVASSVNGLVIIYQCINAEPEPPPADNEELT